jgi:hypothetical protein
VLTGTYEALGRSDAADLIKRHNGRVTGSVSGKTTFLVAGDGCSKSKLEVVRDGGLRLKRACQVLLGFRQQPPGCRRPLELPEQGLAARCRLHAPVHVMLLTVEKRTHNAASLPVPASCGASQGC